MHFFNYKKVYKKCKDKVNVFSQLKIWICSRMKGYCLTGRQRVLNYMKRTRLSRRRIIWLLPPAFPSASCLSFSFFLYVARRACWRERGEGVRQETNHTTTRKPVLLWIIQYSLLTSSIMWPWWAGRGSACSPPASGVGERCNPAMRKSVEVQKLGIAQYFYWAAKLKWRMYLTQPCAADFSLLNLPKGKSLGRSKPATNS